MSQRSRSVGEEYGLHPVAAQATAIGTAARWLLAWRSADGWAPQITAADLDGTSTAPSSRGRRDAWCYGTPGIATALIAAGAALAEPDLTSEGQTALAALTARPETWDTEGPTLCHGHTGILACAIDPETVSRTVDDITAAYDPHHRFCFKHLEHHQPSDEPGLLVGAAGIALVLADHAGLPAPDVTTPWTAALLLAPPEIRHTTTAGNPARPATADSAQ